MSRLSIFFSEMYGEDVKPKHVKKFGGWVFHFREDWPNEADCYKFDGGVICECWDGIKIDISPFGTSDKTTLQKTVAELDRAYNKYLSEYC